MGRRDLRAGRRSAFAAGILALLALAFGTEARGQEVAMAVPPVARREPPARVERYAGGGGDRVDRDLRRRLKEEERRAKEAMDDLHEHEIARLFRESTAIPAFHERPNPTVDPSPSAAFLRAVTPDRQDLRVERRGLERVMEREVGRAWRREWRRDLAVRRAEREGAFADLEHQEAVERATRAFDDAANPSAFSRFPRYWEGHPGSEAAPPRVEGEHIEVLRVGPLALDNEGKIRGDLAMSRTPRDPRGGLYADDSITLDGRLHVSSSLSSPETAFVRELRASLQCSLFGSRDRLPLATVQVQAGFEPRTNEWAVSVMLELLRF